jgi:hypothetical protein
LPLRFLSRLVCVDFILICPLASLSFGLLQASFHVTYTQLLLLLSKGPWEWEEFRILFLMHVVMIWCD